MEVEIKRIDDVEAAEALSLLGYGGSGSGKTWFAGTAGDRAMLVDCGQSPIDTLKSPEFRSRVGTHPQIVSIRETMKRVQIKSRGGAVKIPEGKAYDELCNILDWIFVNKKDDFDTMIVDNAKAVRKFAMVRGLQISDKINRSTTQAKLDEFGFPIPAVQDYGMEMEMMEWFVNTYIDLAKEHKKHFIFLAHKREVFRKSGKVGEPPILVAIRPDFTGDKSPEVIPAPFDEVWYFERAGADYRCRTQGDDMVVAKTTVGAGVLNMYESDPNFLKLLERIKAGKPAPKREWRKK